MKFEQLIEEMKKHSGLSSYYFEMLKSIGWAWEEFTKEYYAYSMFGYGSPEAEVDIVRRARGLGERLGYVFKKIGEADGSDSGIRTKGEK